ncbi:MAG: hypothetical protein R2875_01795 [Desulfobacterales bacterium]
MKTVNTALAATLTAGWQVPMEGDFGLRLRITAGTRIFTRIFDEYDIIDQSISLEPQYTLGQMTFSVPVAFNYAMEDGDTDIINMPHPHSDLFVPDNEQAVAVYAIGSLIDDRDDPLKDEFGNLLYDSFRDTLLDEDAQALRRGIMRICCFSDGGSPFVCLDYQHSVYDAKVIDYDTVSLSQNDREDDIVVAGLDASTS